jgi:anti-anti-sigma factor
VRIRTALDDPLLVPIDVVELGHDVLTVFVEGDIDLDEAGELRAVLGDACVDGHRSIIVDLSGVHFLGSSGLGVLAETAGRLRDEGRTMSVRGCRPAIKRAFEVTGLVRHLDVS